MRKGSNEGVAGAPGSSASGIIGAAAEPQRKAIEVLNCMDAQYARVLFRRCCSSSAWVAQVLAGMPFRDEDHLKKCAAKAKEAMTTADWLESFAGHPRVGRKAKGERDRTDWQKAEQAGAANASSRVLDELEQLNEAYWKKFGFVFLICATGKSAEEMLEAIRERVQKSREEEIQNAAEQESQITALRLEKLLNELDGSRGGHTAQARNK